MFMAWIRSFSRFCNTLQHLSRGILLADGLLKLIYSRYVFGSQAVNLRQLDVSMPFTSRPLSVSIFCCVDRTLMGFD